METYIFHSKIGNIKLFYIDNNLVELSLTIEEVTKNKLNQEITTFINDFNRYLAGENVMFSIGYKMDGSTFQKRVLNEISRIKYGETISYKELAIRSGYPLAARAVGSVCRKNKLPILIPCHRVIKSNGKYGKYIFGEAVKSTLIEQEKNKKNIDI